MLKNISKTPVVLKKSFKRLSRLGIVTEIRQHVKFI
jgi:hypothetical protein